MTQAQLHAKAIEISRRYSRNICELIDILQTLDTRKTFREYECTSLHNYAVKYLKLSEDVASTFITVARKAVKVPDLIKELQDNSITISNARKICSVLTMENQAKWFDLARTLTSNRLGQEIARVNPKAAVNERLTYVTGERLKLVVGDSEEFGNKLKRAQDLVSNSMQSAATFEQTLEAALELFLEKRDPLQKAKRHLAKKSLGAAVTCDPKMEKSRDQHHAALRPVSRRINVKSVTRRIPIAAQTTHQINLRDQGRCGHVDSDGNRCGNIRWLDRHHLVPVAHGGNNSVENLLTLCSNHHHLLHRNSRALDS